MLLWHLGATLFLFRWIFRDPAVDVRWLAFGVVVPDLVDITVGTVLLADTLSTSEAFAHSLAAPSALAVVVLIATRRGRRRRAAMAVVVAMFLHLLIDGMWATTEVFLWPLAGSIPSGPMPWWGGLAERLTSSVWPWILEFVGLAYLAGVAVVSGLGDPAARRELITTGRIRDVE